MSKQISIENLRALIESKEARIGIFGAGYAGLPSACAFAEAGFRTTACDIDHEKVMAIRRGHAYVEDEYVRQLLPSLVTSGFLKSYDDAAKVASMVDFAIIAVPTPLNEAKEPNLAYVVAVTESIARGKLHGKFVILESSVYPGTTEEIVMPILERGGLRSGIDFGLAFSPERIEYGNTQYSVKDIPKVVGGISPLCTQIASQLYAKVIRAPIVQVTSTRCAEAVKMLENTYRYVNIALVNELALLHERLGVDFFEVIAAASTKPFGFHAFYPGPGVGGHCIPKDPHYLSYKARQVGMRLRLVELSQDINEAMTDHIVGRLDAFLKDRGRSLAESRVAILGLAFKGDVSDTRNSPSIHVAQVLMDRGAELSAYDPLVRTVSTKRGPLTSSDTLEEAVKDREILILLTPHTLFRRMNLAKLVALLRPGAVILDTRGFWSKTECNLAGVDYLGLGRP